MRNCAALAHYAYQKARAFGVRFVYVRAATGLHVEGDERVIELDGGVQVQGRAVVLATGVSYRWLGVESVDHYEGRGVFYRPVAIEPGSVDGRRVAIVGGGNSAGQAAVHLAKHADEVVLIVRGRTRRVCPTIC
jgi:thioredoxin reductase (NADPH)